MTAAQALPLALVALALTLVAMSATVAVRRVIRDHQERRYELRLATVRPWVKSDFISTVSHELRTPLTSIVGYLEMFNDGYAGPLTEKQTSMLNVIGRNSNRLLGLIEDILTLTRIESGQFTMNLAQVPLAELFSGVTQAMLPVANERRIDFNVEDGDVLGSLVGDYSQLERMLFNLVSNAIKFTPESGKVTLRTLMAGTMLRIEVEDSGIGIPAAEQHRLFTRFFRSSTASEAAIQGTGLGLTMVKSIVERHGGSIWVHSAEGEGTTVVVDLPLRREAPRSHVLVRHP